MEDIEPFENIRTGNIITIYNSLTLNEPFVIVRYGYPNSTVRGLRNDNRSDVSMGAIRKIPLDVNYLNLLGFNQNGIRFTKGEVTLTRIIVVLRASEHNDMDVASFDTGFVLETPENSSIFDGISGQDSALVAESLRLLVPPESTKFTWVSDLQNYLDDLD